MARAIPLPGGGVRYEPETIEEWQQQSADAQREAYMNGQPYTPGPMPSRFNTGNTLTNQGVPVEARGIPTDAQRQFTLPEAGSYMPNPDLGKGGLRGAQDYDPGTSRDDGDGKKVEPTKNITPPTGPGGGLPTGGDTGGGASSWGTGRYNPSNMSQLSGLTPAMLQYELGRLGLDLKADELEKLGLGELNLKDKVAGWQKEIQDKTLDQNQSQFGSTMDFQRFKDLRDRALQEKELNAKTGIAATGQMQQEEQAKIASAIQAAQSGDNTQLQRLGLSQTAAQAIMAGKSDAERIKIANDQMSQAGLLGKSHIEIERAKLGLNSAGQADASKLARQKTALDASGMLANSAMDRAKLMASLGGPENAFRQMQALRGLDRSGNLQLSAILRGDAPAAAFQAPQAGSRAQSMDTIADQLAGNGSGDARAKNPFGTMADIASGNASGNSVDNSRLSTEGGNFLDDQTGNTGRDLGNQAVGFGNKNYTPDTTAMQGIQDFAGGLGREENANQRFGEQIKGTIGNSATNDILTGIAAPNTAAGTFGNASTNVDQDNYGQKITDAYNTMSADPSWASKTPEEKRATASSIYQNLIPGMTQAQAEQLNDQVHNASGASGGGPIDPGSINNFIKASLGNQAVKGTNTNVGAGTRITDAFNTFDQRNPEPQLAPYNPANETLQDYRNRTSTDSAYGQAKANAENVRKQMAQNLWRNEGLDPAQAEQAHEAGKNYYRNGGTPLNPAQIGGIVNNGVNGRPIQPPAYGNYPPGPNYMPNPPQDFQAPAAGGANPQSQQRGQQPQFDERPRNPGTEPYTGRTLGANPPPGMAMADVVDMPRQPYQSTQGGMEASLGMGGRTLGANPPPGMGPSVQSNVPMQVSTPQPQQGGMEYAGGSPGFYGRQGKAGGLQATSGNGAQQQGGLPQPPPGTPIGTPGYAWTQKGDGQIFAGGSKGFAQQNYGGQQLQPYQAPAAGSSVGGWGQEALNTPKPQPAMAAAPKPGGANPGNPDFTGVKPDPNAQSWEDKQATAFQSGLPAANQLNARNFGRLNNSEKQFTLAGYEAAGQSKDDVMDTIQKTLPKATGPKFGRVA